MATAVVTFTHPSLPWAERDPNGYWGKFRFLPSEFGSAARTEIVSADAESAAGALVAGKEDALVRVLAIHPCWVSIGPDAVAAAGQGRLILAGEKDVFGVVPGDRVAIVAAKLRPAK